MGVRCMPFIGVVASTVLSVSGIVFGQAECNGFGGLRGIRVEGQLMPFVTSLRAHRIEDDATATTANERTRNPNFTHVDKVQTCTGGLAFGRDGGSFNFGDRRQPPPIAFIETFTDASHGVDVDVKLTFNEAFEGDVQFVIDLPNGVMPKEVLRSNLLQLSSPTEQIVITTGETAYPFEVRSSDPRAENHAPPSLIANFPFAHGKFEKDSTAEVKFNIRATGDIDRSPVHLTVDLSKTAASFQGIGGNFRLQNPDADPAIIQYNIEHLRLAWSRLAMPLNLWQPNEDADPANAPLAPQVQAAMEMGKTLAAKKIPAIISVWSAPEWALGPSSFPTTSAARRAATMPDAPNRGTTRPTSRPTTRPMRGRAIRPEKLEALCRSITAYLVYAKNHFGFEPELFSFNESDLGIDVRQTAEEHDQLIKTLGPILQQAGLKTKLLLGDTSDAKPASFIDVAMNDAAAVPFIGAVSFHSWRGGSDAVLAPWGVAAKKLNVPLLVAEGGTDAAAYAYPKLFEEPWFALDEIGLYVRICAIDQPASIIEWQLTSDYSILSGWREHQPLSPTMRFWQLQQLGQTPPGASSVSMSADRDSLQACAYVDVSRGAAAIHIVNAGPARTVTITGLPQGMKALRTLVTESTRGMADAGTVVVESGQASVLLDAMSFTSLIATPQN